VNQVQHCHVHVSHVMDNVNRSSTAPGTRTVPLVAVFPNPKAHLGHSMRAKG
jgi:hypothetical protein